jgi:hypothetical protein
MFKAICRLCLADLMTMLLLFPSSKDLQAQGAPKWTGFARFTRISENDRGKHVWKMEANLVNDTGTATHTYTFSENNDGLKDAGSCSGSYKTTISGGYGEGTKLYGFWIPIPPCKGSSERGVWKGEDETSINVEGQTGDNPNLMSGSIVEKTEGSIDTWEWNFTRARDVELIVAPQNYDSWMPEPPLPANKYGNVLAIKLKVQSRNGGKANEKVSYFKLSLTSTSKQPGTTLNMPLDKANEEPDLRFMEHNNVQVLDATGQSIKLACKDGETGDANIVSFDGGGFTTLTVDAVLNDSTHLKGQLIKSGGEYDILIPKRSASSKIASAWLKQYPIVEDLFDDEVLPGNTNKGDGLTAYEEYRGVISKGQFKRLDPTKMELAVETKKEEANLFAAGLSLFEQATGIEIIPLYTDELTPERMLNKNHDYAHLTDQHAMRIRIGKLAGGILGENQPAQILDKSPKNSLNVIIDIAENKASFQRNNIAAKAAGMTLPYTETELINNTVAHELGHGIHLDHHGPPSVETGPTLTASDSSGYEIVGFNGRRLSIQPGKTFTIEGFIGKKGCDESGDLNCIMAYTSAYNWCHYVANNKQNRLVEYYKAVPFLKTGKGLCASASGTDINANNDFFGDAKSGDCRSKIKVKD